VIYLVIYVAMTVGAFACCSACGRPEGMVEDIDEPSWPCAEQSRRGHRAGIVLFSMAGIPPLAGSSPSSTCSSLARQRRGLWPLAIFGVLASVVGAYYYVRIRQGHVLRRAEGALSGCSLQGPEWVMALSGLFVLLYVIWPGAVWSTRPTRRRKVCSERRRSKRSCSRSDIRSEARWRTLHAALSSMKSARPTPKRYSLRAEAGERGPLVDRGASPDARPRKIRPRWLSEPGKPLRQFAAGH